MTILKRLLERFPAAVAHAELPLTFWGFVSGGVKDALTFGLRLMFVDITEP